MINYFDCKYLTLVGHVQSGKTNEELCYAHDSIKSGLPVIFLVRNITADQLQLVTRISEFNKNNLCNLNYKILSHGTVHQIAKSMEEKNLIILLCNRFQLQKMRVVLKIYQGDYNLCIDEVDFSIKSKKPVTLYDTILDQIKNGANHILGATATPIAVFTTQSDLCKVVKLKPSKQYQGIESLNINYVDNFITKDPRSDQKTINEIYSSLLEKNRAVLLHTVTKRRKNHNILMNYISCIYPEFTYIVYNGDGIRVVCKNRPVVHFTNHKGINKYHQNILRYNIINNEVHFFENYSISEVLQILVNDSLYQHTHISIIAGTLASRGVSFVSTDYTLHLTDQYFHAGYQTHGENYLQALRILGCYNDKLPLTLWCSDRTWSRILEHNKLINNIVNCVNNNKNWLSKIKNVVLSKPKSPLTRPKLTTKFRKISNDHFALDLEESENEEL
jgi:hypothetical protein